MSGALLAQSEAAPDLSGALLLMVVGMLVVFAALVLLLLAIVLINWLGGAEAQPAEADTSLAPARRAGELDPQMLAVLTAAATVALQRPARVTGARRLEGEAPRDA
ncbi:MAG: OadG family transporter subunit [Phycisphaeraceae bacterium]